MNVRDFIKELAKLDPDLSVRVPFSGSASPTGLAEITVVRVGSDEEKAVLVACEGTVFQEDEDDRSSE